MANHQIAYMPYIECEKFTFGRVTFVPFYNSETQDLFSDDVSDFLEWYFAKHVDQMGNHKNIVILCLNGQPLGPWDNDEREEIRNTVAFLCFPFLYYESPPEDPGIH